MRQKYIDAIKSLREEAADSDALYPDEWALEVLAQAWNYPYQTTGGELFVQTRHECGCLTQIKADPEMAHVGLDKGLTPELLAELLADQRIPDDVGKLRLDQLEAFAEWQDRLDDLYGEDRSQP